MVSTRRFIRTMLGAGTVGAFGLGLLGDSRFYALSGLLGTLWWLFDVMLERVFEPMGEAFWRVLHGDTNLPPANVRPTARETIALLERRLATPVSAAADVPAALRLADLYRVVLKDPARADALIAEMEARYPGTPELATYVSHRQPQE